MKLLLFDIDGTLLRTHGIGRRSVERALEDVLDHYIDTSPVHFSGKTDPQIIEEVLLAAGYARSELNGTVGSVLERYRELMEQAIRPERVDVLPGVPTLIERLHERDDVQLGLLTGNIEPLAYRKLEAAGLADYFPFGAFGSDNPDRYKLPPVAVERARAHTGREYTGSDIVIIGDTEHDIGCGRSLGAFAVAVCTGRFDRACLSAFGADVLFDTLENCDDFIDAVLR